MKRKIVLSSLLVLTLLFVLAGVKTLQVRAMIEAGKEFSVPPEAVSSAPVKEERWPQALGAVGSVSPVQGVVLRAEVAGRVTQIGFQNGGTARQGQVLLQLDTSSEEAQRRAAEAQLELAELNLARARDLRAQNLIAQQDLDAAVANAKQLAGQVDNIRAAIAKRTIHAPFSGRLGIRQVNLGQVVGAGDPIVSLQSLDPVYVDFTLPEQRLSALRPGMPVRVTTDAAHGETFTGALTAINPDVDATTRNVRLQATIANREDRLRPGMFARVEVGLPEAEHVLAVPATAVLHAPYGDSVFVIGETKDEKTGTTHRTVRMTTVRLGSTRGDFVAITEGLKPGETVVSSGVFKLRNGSPVVINNELAPKAEDAPRPANS